MFHLNIEVQKMKYSFSKTDTMFICLNGTFEPER